MSRISLIAGTALAGALTLHPSGLARVRDARIQPAPDAVVQAVATRNPALLELALAEGIDVNARDAQGRTALAVALAQRDHALVDRLLALGASVDLGDERGVTPLMTALKTGDMDAFRTFLAHSKNPAARDADGNSAAYHAILTQNYAAFDLLLPSLPEVDQPAADGRDLLALAFDSGDVRFLKSVLTRVPDGLAWNPRTLRALRNSIASEDGDLTRILLCKHRDGPTAGDGSIPLLAQAIVDDDSQVFRGLLAAGADANTVFAKPSDKAFIARVPSEFVRDYIRGDEGFSVLMLAAGLGKTEYVRALLEAGADRNRQTKRYKMLALYFAARSKETTVVQILLGHGPTRDRLRVEISLATQKASVIKDGVAILHTSVSTGRKGFDTPAGEYVITDKQRSHVSTLYHVEMPFFMRLSCRDFGMHAGNVPNYPASHGCIRLPADMAQKLFSEIPVGTVVTIN
ncbi:MAG: ankyrin repeat domain-containing protein [Chthoniobacterales bacterium]